MIRIILLASLCIAALACRNSPESEVPESSPGLPAWNITSQPEIVLGASPDDVEDQFARVAGAVVVDGKLTVVDYGAAVIRAYDRAGKVLWSRERQGRGPGEFMRGEVGRMGAPFIIDGMIAVPHHGRSQLSLFDRGGEFLRDVSYPDYAGFDIIGASTAGSMIGVRALHRFPARDSLQVVVFDSISGKNAHTFVVGTDSVVRDGLVHGSPFQPYVIWTVADAGLILGWGAEHELTYYSMTPGVESRVVSWQQPKVPVRDQHIEANYRLNEDLVRQGGTAEQQEAVLKILAGQRYPDFFPAYDFVLQDTDGCVWVRSYPPPGSLNHNWFVLSQGGSLVATAETPPWRRVLFVDRAQVVALNQDALEVEYVQIHTLTRSDAACRDVT